MSVTTPPTLDRPSRVSALDLAAALGTPPPTAEQQAVIEGPLRPTVVVAGAGSGKTETMAARVVWLVANGLVAPQDVLGLTFTRKAALELGARLSTKLRRLQEVGLWTRQEQQLSDAAAAPTGVLHPPLDEAHLPTDDVGPGPDGFDLPTISTYHAYAGRLVDEHGLRLGVEPDSVLLSEAACWQLAHDLVHRHEGDLPGLTSAPATVVRAVLALAGELGEHLVQPSQAIQFLERVADRLVDLEHEGQPLKTGEKTAETLRVQALLYPLVEDYRRAKAARGALDFGDQMALAARLARDIPEVGMSERTRFRAVLLDEFQDTSEAQMVLLTSLFAGHDLSVTAVGDPHQSIYGWRGASATTLTRFPTEFAVEGRPAQVLQLTTSWRNDRHVLDVANTVSAPLREETSVPVAMLRPGPGAADGSVEVARLLDHVAEAEHVADWVQERWVDADTGTAAVLCRARAQFPVVVDALRRRGLPVEVVGLGGLLDTPEVLDLVALLWLAQEPTRGDQAVRLLAGPVCRLGAADIDALWAWARLDARHGGAEATRERGHAPVLAEAVEHPPPPGWVGPGGEHLSPEGQARVAWLSGVLGAVRRLTGLPLPDLVTEAERLLGLDIEVASDPDLHPSWGRAPLDALADVAAGYAAGADRVTLGGFLAWLDAAREHERGLEGVEVPELAEVSVDTSAIQVLTVHAAKGLEWDAVAVPGLVEGTFPAGRVTPVFADGRWQVKERREKGWLAGIGRLPTPLRGDRQGRPDIDWLNVPHTRALRSELEELELAHGRFSVQEERRLAYVAFTRARHRVLITAPVWSTGTRPRITSRFLDELRAVPGVSTREWLPMPDPEDPEQLQHPRLTEQQTATWPLARDERRRFVLDVSTALVSARAASGQGLLPLEVGEDRWGELIELLLAERAERSKGADAAVVPEHLSTSSLVELAGDPAAFRRRLRRPVPTPPAAQARLGTAFHAWVEQHYATATLVDLHQLELDDVTEPADLDHLRRTFLASEWADRSPSAIEVALETVVGGRSVRGRIDAVFPDADGGVTIVDWKTGSPGSAQEQRLRALQLAVYRVAYARLTGRDLTTVRAAFFYARSGQTVRPDLPDEKEVETMVHELVGEVPTGPS